ncbi:unnamed protein product, partial [Ectocarpus sp. 13 AM-2016]
MVIVSSTNEPYKRQRYATEPGTGKDCGGVGAAAARKTRMQDVIHKGCGHPGCIKRPSFGNDGSKKAEFCSQHSQQGMVNVVSKRCGHPGCTKHPTYGQAGSKKAEFCSQHAWTGMANVVSKRCGHPGCMKYPTFGQA